MRKLTTIEKLDDLFLESTDAEVMNLYERFQALMKGRGLLKAPEKKTRKPRAGKVGTEEGEVHVAAVKIG